MKKRKWRPLGADETTTGIIQFRKDGPYVCEDDPILSDSLIPSKEKSIFWIDTEDKTGKIRSPTKNTGKWLIFVMKEKVDSLWEMIKKATEEGKLGPASKVSTRKENPNSMDKNSHVICVYTSNWKNKKDVDRVRDQLRKMGITMKIPYKTDEATSKGRFQVSGHKNISKYNE